MAKEKSPRDVAKDTVVVRHDESFKKVIIRYRGEVIKET